jgi:hypothetical protein
MPHEEMLLLLTKARAVLDRYMFEGDGEAIRDDVAEICMAIDSALPDAKAGPVRAPKSVPLEVERTAA